MADLGPLPSVLRQPTAATAAASAARQTPLFRQQPLQAKPQIYPWPSTLPLPPRHACPPCSPHRRLTSLPLVLQAPTRRSARRLTRPPAGCASCSGRAARNGMPGCAVLPPRCVVEREVKCTEGGACIGDDDGGGGDGGRLATESCQNTEGRPRTSRQSPCAAHTVLRAGHQAADTCNNRH